MVGHIGVVSHHLQSLLDRIELIVSCAFVFKVGYDDAQIGRVYFTSRGFEFLASLGKCN